MNASDIIKATQNRTLYQAYYRPTIFPGIEASSSTINFFPISTVSSSDGFISSFISSVTLNYLYTCQKPTISYELLNSINQGKYLCKFPYCSTLVQWNDGQTFVSGNCNCNISFLTWKNTTNAPIYQYNSTSYSSFAITSSLIASGPTPIICPISNISRK